MACSDLQTERNQFQSTSSSETGKDETKLQHETVRLQEGSSVCHWSFRNIKQDQEDLIKIKDNQSGSKRWQTQNGLAPAPLEGSVVCLGRDGKMRFLKCVRGLFSPGWSCLRTHPNRAWHFHKMPEPPHLVPHDAKGAQCFPESPSSL